MSDGVTVTLGSVVAYHGEYGVVWHATGDTLRVLRIQRGMTSLRLSLANEVALHLPVSLGGWSIAYDGLVTWPRPSCSVLGELNERCLLKILEARRTTTLLTLFPAIAGNAVSESIGQMVSH
jgi:hypothetical protein